jgi:heme A synthase
MARMTDHDVDGRPLNKAPRSPLPAGYRQGIISAITVLLGFSLLFLRYWNFEAEGEWTIAALVATILLALAIVLELFALWRSLQPKDDDETEYQITLRWFLASIVVLLVSLLLAGLIVSHAINF